jgi:hypothetical protein
VSDAAEVGSIDEEYDVIFTGIQSGTRQAGHSLVQRAAWAGRFVVSMDRSYSYNQLSSNSLHTGDDSYRRWAGEEGPPD